MSVIQDPLCVIENFRKEHSGLEWIDLERVGEIFMDVCGYAEELHESFTIFYTSKKFLPIFVQQIERVRQILGGRANRYDWNGMLYGYFRHLFLLTYSNRPLPRKTTGRFWKQEDYCQHKVAQWMEDVRTGKDLSRLDWMGKMPDLSVYRATGEYVEVEERDWCWRRAGDRTEDELRQMRLRPADAWTPEETAKWWNGEEYYDTELVLARDFQCRERLSLERLPDLLRADAHNTKESNEATIFYNDACFVPVFFYEVRAVKKMLGKEANCFYWDGIVRRYAYHVTGHKPGCLCLPRENRLLNEIAARIIREHT